MKYRTLRTRDSQTFMKICPRQLRDIPAREHSRASICEHHETCNRILQQFAPGNREEIVG
jgi:hypothetical protein